MCCRCSVADVQEFERKVVARSSRSQTTNSKQEKDEGSASEDDKGKGNVEEEDNEDEDEDDAPRRPVCGPGTLHFSY